MTDQSVVLSGIVEMDEICTGAPPRNQHGGGPSGVRSRRGPRRLLVLTMVERSGTGIGQPTADGSRSRLWRCRMKRFAFVGHGQHPFHEARRPPSAQRFLKIETGRVLKRLIRMTRPAHIIIIEKLDFRTLGLSRRLNRVLVRSGRKVIREKLGDIEERYSIAFAEVKPVYSSQTCSACGHVAKDDCKIQSDFSCRAC